jgi:hypothetical protein
MDATFSLNYGFKNKKCRVISKVGNEVGDESKRTPRVKECTATHYTRRLNADYAPATQRLPRQLGVQTERPCRPTAAGEDKDGEEEKSFCNYTEIKEIVVVNWPLCISMASVGLYVSHFVVVLCELLGIECIHLNALSRVKGVDTS